ncbi:hypothetical protein UA08_02671 [Talaromyces atroroseus]|uniref:ABC transporter domain-containing protein n=1 Tax=Talaromyces atroroseus TaxID=1441469 RepID=A0A225B904_TALAT|nr:hypothetical protein UA08_02671 [Talaromyces atroroseus]OKL62437.1 hypothetical protein UA08_02671 [Talaromyces atroroseus]
MTRAGLVSMIYHQTSILKSGSIKDQEAITLQGTDVEQPFQFRPGRQMLSEAWVERVEKRISITSTILGDLKAIKMLGLEQVLTSLITGLRQIELNTSARFQKLIFAQVVISNVPLNFAPFATFVVYAIIAVVRKDETLLASRAFTALSLMSIFTGPLLVFLQSGPTLMQSLGCFTRIEVYCSKSPATSSGSLSTVTLPLPQPGDMELDPFSAPKKSNAALVSFKNADIAWSSDTDIVLHRLNLDIFESITMITGPVGSGKSTLLESVLGEANLRNGKVTTGPFLRCVAYCSQKPWIINNTIRSNIIGGSEFNPEWYKYTIWACALEEDLKTIPLGDMCKSESNGVSLSGGQKQRVALARAIYSKLPVLILDDAFSGLDLNTVALLSDRLFAKDGFLRRNGISVILVTHTQQLLPLADRVIALNEGVVISDGPFNEALAKSTGTSIKHSIKHSIEIDTHSTSSSTDDMKSEANSTEQLSTVVYRKSKSEEIGEQDVSRRDGTWRVYEYYIKTPGYKTAAFFVFAVLIAGFFSNFAILWLEWWSNANAKQPNGRLGFYLGVYAVIFALNLTGLAVACWLFFINIINKTALGMHSDLLKATLRSWSYNYKAFSLLEQFFPNLRCGLRDTGLIHVSNPISAAKKYPQMLLLPQSRESRHLPALPVFFLCPLDDSKISEICKRICSEDETWTDRPDGEVKPVVPVPWIHNQIPPLSAIFDIGGTIFIDEQSANEGTAIVAKSPSKVARVPLNRVNLVTQALQGRSRPFDKLVTEIISVEEQQGDITEAKKLESTEQSYTLPDHLPKDIKLDQSTLTLISLVHLSEDDITGIKTSIGTSTGLSGIVIYNWPESESPCSRADMYRLFSQLKPNIHPDCDETFVLFIDQNPAELECYHILRAHKWTRERNQSGEYEDFDTNVINIRALKDVQHAVNFWHMMWNPFENGGKGIRQSDSRVNSALFNIGSNSLYGGYSEMVANPDKLVITADIAIFVLAPMTETDLRIIRSYIMKDVEDEFCIYDVSKKLKSPNMEGLIGLFSTEEFVTNDQHLPSFFIAVDTQTLDIARSVMSQAHSTKVRRVDDSEALVVASNREISLGFMDDMDNVYAEVNLGYAYARQSPEDAFSTCVNLSVANMDFFECANIEHWVTWSCCDKWLENNPVIDEIEEFGPYIPWSLVYYPGEDDARRLQL